MNKKLFFVILISSITMCSCDTLGSGYSSNKNNIARGLTGGGIGGGIIIVDNITDFSSDSSYTIYLEEKGKKTKIQSGKTNSSGKIEIAENSLSFDRVKKIQSGDAKIIVEIADGDQILTAEGSITTNSENGEKQENYLA
ncbi:MAG: hypothetical protein AABZ74_00560 [Cyanobacteriota bacterium]